MHTTNMLPTHLVGFDPLFRLLEAHREEKTSAYPPHDLVQFGDDRYRLTFAVAGFTEDELSIWAEGNKLRVTGQKQKSVAEDDAPKPTVIHQGIARRSFDQTFRLGPHIRVQGANLENGLLHVDLERVVPEELRPRQIEIKR